MDDVLFFYDDGKPKYQGHIVNGRMEGKGKYYFENGNEYIGEFFNNAFHGTGTIHFPGSGVYEATWKYGKAIDGKYTFSDGLDYQEENWSYCTPEDRRFNSERQSGIRPAGNDQLANDPARVLPRGCYDVGDGYLNPGGRWPCVMLVLWWTSLQPSAYFLTSVRHQMTSWSIATRSPGQPSVRWKRTS
jgi:hypothetical protein